MKERMQFHSCDRLDGTVETLSRHQCLVYEGEPSRRLPGLAVAVRDRLLEGYRCLYFNSPPMIAELRSCLAATGVDVATKEAKAGIVLSSERHHLQGGCFDLERMIGTLESALDQALVDGYQGLWATGDMTWEMGPDKDFSKLIEYEWRLERFFEQHPEMSGVCQYHKDTLPRRALWQGLRSHRTTFINETISIVNPYYLYDEDATMLLDSAIR
jgi:hypothetical protein